MMKCRYIIAHDCNGRYNKTKRICQAAVNFLNELLCIIFHLDFRHIFSHQLIPTFNINRIKLFLNTINLYVYII